MIHSPTQVADDVVHTMEQLGLTRPLTLETMLTVSMLYKAKCLLMLLTRICSRVLQQMPVSDTGL